MAKNVVRDIGHTTYRTVDKLPIEKICEAPV